MFHLHILTPIAGLIINVITQVVSFRCNPSFGLLKSEYLGFTIGVLNIFIFDFYFFSISEMSANDFIGIITANLIIYSALGYCYFHFINLGETARRIRILREIYDAEDGLSLEEMLQKYNAKEIVEKRVSRLINNRQILYKNGRYYIGSPIVLMIARIIVAMKLLLLGKRSEFDTY